ncbi:hypothetical protein Poly51_26520 [Rubripirellula tenax]|uniref:Uncharacterized protein n=1 Tax=Rubripirellula tenax TaxID=2528015 RepID=A0A5C6F665_9BACT|nr:hypothetical protein [Rubripirellula tenax]TWU56735.1 hypothetical protein Poly51_26520 [Rubripirellula tenax]
MRFRRYLRFRLRTLLALPIVFSLGWYWCDAPNRAIRHLHDALASGDLQAANALIANARFVCDGTIVRLERSPSWPCDAQGHFVEPTHLPVDDYEEAWTVDATHFSELCNQTQVVVAYRSRYDWLLRRRTAMFYTPRPLSPDDEELMAMTLTGAAFHVTGSRIYIYPQ